MSHLKQSQAKLLNRLRRIRGQLNAVEKALTDGDECSVVLHPLVACRGALNGLMGEILEGHIRHHIVDPDKNSSSDRARATIDLIEVLRSYLR